MKLSILVRAIALAVVLCSTLIPASAEEARLLRNPRSARITSRSCTRATSGSSLATAARRDA